MTGKGTLQGLCTGHEDLRQQGEALCGSASRVESSVREQRCVNPRFGANSPMKKKIYRHLRILVAVAVIGFAAPGLAHAYLDPGTASLIIQGLIATLAGMAVAGRLYWSRLKKMFGFDRKGEKIDDNQDIKSDNDTKPEE